MHASEFNVEKFVDIIEKENGTISEVYFVACGGSLVDLYSSCYFINRESSTMTAEWITSKEFVLTPPKKPYALTRKEKITIFTKCFCI